MSVVFDLRDRSVTRALYMFREYEPLETELVAKLVRSGMTFLDIGANIGYYFILASNLVGDEGHVVAFEPSPENVGILRRNISLNRLSNVTVEECAISNDESRIPLYLSHINAGDHRIYIGDDDDFYNAGRERESTTVRSITLDEYLAGQGLQPDFIKLDIQGAEDLALKGMIETLRRNSEVIMMAEFWPHGLHRAGAKPKQFLLALSSLGFDLYQISSGPSLRRANAREIISSLNGKDSETLFLSRLELKIA